MWWIQLSDFGLAIVDGSQSKSNIKLSGTLGYVAPEYLLDGKLSQVAKIRFKNIVSFKCLEPFRELNDVMRFWMGLKHMICLPCVDLVPLLGHLPP